MRERKKAVFPDIYRPPYHTIIYIVSQMLEKTSKYLTIYGNYSIISLEKRKMLEVFPSVDTYPLKEEKSRGEIMISKNEIGQYIKKYLIDHNITVGEFSKLVNASPASVYNWIAGKPMLPVYYNNLLSVLREYL